jgi:hypothetical protein
MGEEVTAHKFEFGISHDEGRSFIVTRAFMMKVLDGPLVRAEAGEVVFLSPELGNELFFSGKVIPCELGEHYEAVKDFQVVQGGEYFRVKKGDVVKLSRDEAISLLRSGDVKEKKGGN